MLLTTHLLVGTALSRVLVPASVEGSFFLGFLSHYCLDALPHWDYPLKSRQEDEANRLNLDFKLGQDFLWDLLKVGGDLLVGLILATAILDFAGAGWSAAAAAAAVGAVLPDFLQFAYAKLRWPPLRWLQIIHRAFHSRLDWKNRPLPGLVTQLLVIWLSVLTVLMAML